MGRTRRRGRGKRKTKCRRCNKRRGTRRHAQYGGGLNLGNFQQNAILGTTFFPNIVGLFKDNVNLLFGNVFDPRKMYPNVLNLNVV